MCRLPVTRPRALAMERRTTRYNTTVWTRRPRGRPLPLLTTLVVTTSSAMVMRARNAVRTVTVRCRPEITARGVQVTTRRRGGVVVDLTFLANVRRCSGVPVALVVGWVTDLVN